jgi:hypothetical protein
MISANPEGSDLPLCPGFQVSIMIGIVSR